MELVIFLRLLWLRRIQVALGALAAIAIAVAAGGSPVPPSGAAATGVLVDTPRSQLIANVSPGMYTLSYRATLLAMLLGAGPARDQLAREMHVPAGQIAVVDQELTSPATPASLPVAAIQAANETPEPYVLTVATDDTVPIVSIHATAPDRIEAAGLAEAAVRVLEAAASPHDTAELQGLIITQIDPVTAVEAPGGASRKKMAITAVFVFGIWCVGLALWARRGRGRRRLLRRPRSAAA